MKFICVVLFVSSYFYTEARIIITDEQFSIRQIFKTKCDRKSGGEKAFVELEDQYTTSVWCINNVGESIDKEDVDEYCEELINNEDIYKCLLPFGQTLHACLDEEESYLPTFLYGAFNHTLTEYCGTTGYEKYKYVINTVKTDKSCFHRNYDLVKTIKKCFPDLAIFKTSNSSTGKSYTVQREEICVDMVNFRTCVTESINEQCVGTDYTKMIRYFMEPVLSWCAKNQ